MASDIGVFAAFGAGVLTFLSPCVLPLIPGYVAFMTGLRAAERDEDARRVPASLVPALLFVAGFSAVFVALGASASAAGSFLAAHRSLLESAAGVIVIALGVLMLGVIRVPWLYGEARFEMQGARRFGSAGALVMGMAFAFGWSPCVGPILGSILMLAAGSAEPARGAVLLGVYSAGLGVPFVVTALALGRVKPLIGWLNRRAVVINRIAGSVLVLLGVLILTGWLAPVVGVLTEVIPKVGG